MKTNSKKARENIRAYILDNFDFSGYEGTEQEPKKEELYDTKYDGLEVVRVEADTRTKKRLFNYLSIMPCLIVWLKGAFIEK